jgi:TonB family protein
MSRCFILFVISSALVQGGMAVQGESRRMLLKPAALRSEMAIGQQKGAVLRVRDFADRALNFKDPGAKISVLIALADLLWKFDEGYARQLFQKAYDFLLGSQLAGWDLTYFRQEIIGTIARHDPAMAQRLANVDSFSVGADSNDLDRAETHLIAAYKLIEDKPGKAVEFAEESLRWGVSPRIMLPFLLKLQRKDQMAADALFLKALSRLIAQPFVDGNDLLLLGTYVFTSPLEDIPAESLQMVGVGNNLVYNISATRSSASPTLVRAYIDAAISILARPILDQKQKQLYYIAGYQLLPKVEQFAPDRSWQLLNAMASLAHDIPPALTQPSTYADLAAKTSVSSIDEIDKMPDVERREGQYLSLAYTLWRRNEFARAREVGARIKTPSTRDQLMMMIKFGEAAKALDEGRISSAEELASSLPSGIERSIIWLGIARASLDEGHVQRAYEALNAALTDVRRLEGARRPYLILAAAGLLARIDPQYAVQTLSEAVRAFNAQDEEAFSRIAWTSRIEAGNLWRDFPLKVKGVEFDFNQPVLSLLAIDSDWVISILLGLQYEDILGQALVALARALLKAPPRVMGELDSANANSPEKLQSPQGIKISEISLRKRATKSVMPVFPEEARRRKAMGVAVAQVDIDERGEVEQVEILESPDPSIKDAVIAAIKQWKFKPATINDKPVRIQGKLTFYYVIDDKGARVENPKRIKAEP